MTFYFLTLPLDSPGFIYVIGGISDEGMELCSAEVYDPISRRWSALPVMVTRRAYVGVACLNNCIYAVGGWNEALGALETVEKYCPEEVMWGKKILSRLFNDNLSDSFTRTFPHLCFAVSTGEMDRGGLNVYSTSRCVCIRRQWVAVCRRGSGRQQRLLCPGDGGLCGDL